MKLREGRGNHVRPGTDVRRRGLPDARSPVSQASVPVAVSCTACWVGCTASSVPWRGIPCRVLRSPGSIPYEMRWIRRMPPYRVRDASGGKAGRREDSAPRRGQTAETEQGWIPRSRRMLPVWRRRAVSGSRERTEGLQRSTRKGPGRPIPALHQQRRAGRGSVDSF